MRWLVLVLMIELLMGGVHALEAPTTGTGASAPTILVFGDSLSAAYGMPVDRGWVNLLQQRLVSKGYPHRVDNASVSGETTRGGLDRLAAALSRAKPAIVIIELGANDGLQGKPMEQMAAQLEALVGLSRQHGAKPLLVRMRLPPNYGPAYIEKFVAVYEDTARKLDVPLSGFMLEGVAGDPQFTQDDGLHPNEAGQPLILENLWPSIEPMLSTPVRQSAGSEAGAKSP
jgi:acyl-CoA thioesterase I